MDLARYVVEAVVLEGRSYRDVARAHGVSKSWVGKLVGSVPSRADTRRSSRARGRPSRSRTERPRGWKMRSSLCAKS